MCFNGTHRWLVTSKGQSPFLSKKFCQGQLQTPQSPSVLWVLLVVVCFYWKLKYYFFPLQVRNNSVFRGDPRCMHSDPFFFHFTRPTGADTTVSDCKLEHVMYVIFSVFACDFLSQLGLCRSCVRSSVSVKRQVCSSRFKSSGMLHRVYWKIFTIVLKDHSLSSSAGSSSEIFLWLLVSGDEVITILRSICYYLPI